MTAYTWIGGTGDWGLASNWSPSSPAGPPGAADTATISATGPAYTVTINTADVAKSLTENSSSATVDDAGSLTLGKTFTLGAGTFVLDGGKLIGGTTKVIGGTFVCDGGTLRGVTYDGTLDLSGSDARVHLAAGTVVNDPAGAGAGTIDDTGEDSTLYFDNTQTFNNATINLGSTSFDDSVLSEYDTTGAGSVLTLGSNVTLDESGNAEITDSGYAGDGIVNEGNISQTASGGDLIIYGSSFTNNGTITAASSGGALTIDSTTFTNNGAIDISDGDRVTIEPFNFTNSTRGIIAVGANSWLYLTLGGAWSNLGSITLASGSRLGLGGSFTLAGLGKLTNSGGTVDILGTLDNTGGTLNGSNGLGQLVLLGGTIQGGTVTPSGLSFSSSSHSTLSGVTYDGTLDLSGDSVHLASGTVVNNAAGTGAGTINDTGAYSKLYFDGKQTFNNATINLGSTSRGYCDLIDHGALTLGSNVTINESGHAAIADFDSIVDLGNLNQTGSGGDLHIGGNSSFTNDGTITAASSGGALTIETSTFTNFGTLAVSNGESVDVGTAVTGTGTDTISAASTLEFDSAVSSSTTVGAQTIDFLGGGALDLNDPTGFYGEVSGFAAGDEVELLGSWAFSGFSENPAGTLATLTLASGSTTHSFEFVGDYAQGDFKITSGATSIVTHT